MARRRRAIVAMGIGLSAAAVAAAIALAASADVEPTTVTASLTPVDAGPPQLEGSWPAETTTTVAGPVDPNAGITVSGPIGPPWPDSFMVADAIVAEVPIYEAPGKRAASNRTLPNPTVEGYDLVMLVREQRRDWLRVQINTRPNGATTWVRSKDVAVRTVPNHILIELGAKKLTVFHGDEEVWSTTVAPGKASSPTPTGAFYVDILTRPDNPNGPYGPFQVSVTGFSEVYDSFGGGNGQIAIHGTNRPELIGTPASNGCVRMSNEDITALIPLARQGTPVVIVD